MLKDYYKNNFSLFSEYLSDRKIYKLHIINKTMEKDRKKKYCEKCKKKTSQLRCGFGTFGGLTGNCRWRCLECGEEKNA